MTKQEAMQAMEEGKKVTHKSFLDYEYLELHADKYNYTDEGGDFIIPYDFWEARKKEHWNEGWSIWAPSTPPQEEQAAAPAYRSEGLEGHTAGEWEVFIEEGKYSHSYYVNVKDEPVTIAIVYGGQENADLIASAPSLLKENKELKQLIQKMERSKIMAMELALEFGYKQCEKGENIQGAFINFNKTISNE